MHDKAQVVSITENGMVNVIPFIKDACLSCGLNGCGKRGKIFTVANPRNIPIKSGMMVRVGASKYHQVLQAFVSIIIPIVCAIASQLIINAYEQSTQIIIREGFKALFFLLALIIPSVAIYFISKKIKLIQSEIMEIAQESELTTS